MVFATLKYMPVMLLLCSINRKSFIHDKSSSTSQLLKDNLNDLQKLLRYLSGIVFDMHDLNGALYLNSSFKPSILVNRILVAS